MKREDAYIEKISKTFNIPLEEAECMYRAINKYDWDVFCSYMGDYDYPGERRDAKEKLDAFVEHYRISDHPEYEQICLDVQTMMKGDREYNIHEMRKEV